MGSYDLQKYDTSKATIRKVCQSGCIWVSQKEFYVGQTLTGEYVAIQENEKEEKEIFFGPVYLGKFDLIKGLEKPKLVTRRNFSAHRLEKREHIS